MKPRVARRSWEESDGLIRKQRKPPAGLRREDAEGASGVPVAQCDPHPHLRRRLRGTLLP